MNLYKLQIATLLLVGLNFVTVESKPKHWHKFFNRKDALETFEEERTEALETEASWRYGSTQSLSSDDEILNSLYVSAKVDLLESGYNDQSLYRPSTFFLDKEMRTPPTDVIYEIIKRLPKGALLHAHQIATHDLNTFPEFTLTIENCQYCENPEGDLILHYLDAGVSDPSEEFECRPCPQEGDESYEKDLKQLKKKLSMFDGINYAEATTQLIWDLFEKKFGPIGDSKKVWHVWKAFLEDNLDWMVADNVQYVEFRVGCKDITDRNGTVIPFETVLDYLQNRVASFRKENPNFYGVNLICQAGRVGLTDEKLLEKLDLAQRFSETSPLIRGFDLVGWEDMGRTLHSVAPVLLKWKEDTNSKLVFAFHAGETLWTGYGVDENVLDAVLLNTKRIGHGYALDAHPRVVEMLKERNVGVELNPISNQVLGLVDDLRNHRNKQLMDITHKPSSSNGKDYEPLRFSVNSDDCLIFGSRPVTDDMYSIVLAMTEKDSDLRVLKRFAYDSIEISLLHSDEKAELVAVFEHEWDRVVSELISEFRK